MRFVSPARKNSRRVGFVSSIARRAAGALALAVLATSVGCTNDQLEKTGKIIGDYLNLRNSFLNPAEVGRFDKANPFGEARFVQLPILDTLNIVDQSVDSWANAQDPTPADLQPENKEYVFGVGDTISVSVFELVTPGTMYERTAQITETGAVNVGSLGNIPMTGLTPTQLEEKVRQIIIEKGIIAAPQVTVTLIASRQRIFSILGAVSQPGTYNIIANDFRLLDALALARDVQVQPGMDYLFVIRQGAVTDGKAGTPTVPAAGGKVSNPADDILDLGKTNKTQPGAAPDPTTMPIIPGAAPVPSTTPTIPGAGSMKSPDSAAPKLVRDLPEGFEEKVAGALVNAGPPVVLGDLMDQAMTTSAPATTAAAPATAPATTAGPASPPDPLLDAAMSQPDDKQFIFVEGKLVAVPKKTATQVAPGVTPVQPTTIAALPKPPATDVAIDPIQTQRVIRIPIQALREGVSRYNIVIRPGDVINIPGAEPGEFYLMGHVSRPGVYTLTGRKVTLKQAVAAAGNLDGLAVPRRCDLIRRIGPNQEVTVQVDLQAIFDGEQPDIFIKPNDVLNVGTDAVQAFLAVTRNAYRASYGWGFVYDKNYGDDDNDNR